MRRRAVLAMAAVGLGGFVLLAIAGLTPKPVVPQATPPRAFDIAVDARMEDGGVVVHGATNLPAGATISIYVWHENAEADLTLRGLDKSVFATSVDGEFSVAVPVEGWPSGKVNVSATFSVGDDAKQPDSVLEVVGLNGERLAGPKVSTDEYNVRFLTAITSLVIGE